MKIIINDCEREIVISNELIISFDEYNRMREALMKIKHPNLIIEKPRNKWVQNFIKSENDKHSLRNLMISLGHTFTDSHLTSHIMEGDWKKYIKEE